MAAITVQGFPSPAGPLDVVIQQGERVRVVGPNGSGKTSLLRAMAGLTSALEPSTALLDGDPVRGLAGPRLAARLGIVHQDPRDGLIGLTVASEHRFRGQRAPDDHRDVATLSSGEARRVALAVTQAPILLLDEPVEGLDTAGLEALRSRIAGHAGTVVFVDHDGRLADLATRTITLAAAAHPPMPEIPVGTGAPWHAAGGHLRTPAVTVPTVSLSPGLHALTGPNGCGKTTALRHWAGIGTRPDPAVSWMGPRARDMLQGPRLAAGPGDVPAHLIGRHPLTLSGGETQRVALAAAMARPRRVVLLDEPEAHLDGAGRAWLAAQIGAAVAAGRIVVVATHDTGLIALAQSVIPMEAS